MKKIYSFDIFDTCLVRACGDPHVVFDLLAKQVLGEDAADTALVDFAFERIKAEQWARKKLCVGDKEEVTLEEIYKEADFSFWTDIDNSRIMAIELKIEEGMLLPVVEMRDKINALRKAGHQIVYISDMYLPQKFIANILKRYDFLKEGDKIYVSCEYNKDKRSGNLYRFVAQDLHQDFRNWAHYGDNGDRDYAVPKRLGIKAKLVKHDFTRYEKIMQMLEQSSVSHSHLLMASISKAIRLSNEKSPYLYFAADFVAPMYVPFVYSVMKDAEHRGIKDLFFMARDGYVFYKIAEIFRSCFPTINIHYLCVSRKALYLPSITKIDFASLQSRLLYYDNLNIDDVLERFHLSEHREKFKKYDGIFKDDLLKALLKDSDFVSLLQKKIEQQRALCLSYLEQEGVTKCNCAVVDLSGTIRCSHYLNAIIETKGYPRLHSYYFDVVNQRVKYSHYYAQNFSERYFYTMNKSPQNIFEEYFSLTDQGSTMGYALRHGEAKPVFEEIAEDTIAFRKRIMDANILACQEFARLYTKLIRRTDNHEQLSNSGLIAFTMFLRAPQYYYIRALEGVTVTASSAAHEFPIIYHENFLKVLRRRYSYYWMFGQLVYNAPFKNLLSNYYHFRLLQSLM